jgi:hypothetical protein
MNRKAILYVTIVLVVIALTLLHYFSGIFTRYNVITAKWDIIGGELSIIQFGEQDATDEYAVKLAPKFGFKYKKINDCIVSTPDANGIDQYNSLMTTYLNKKNGKTWKEKFEIEIDSTFRESQVEKIRETVLSIDHIKKMNHSIDSMTGGKRQLYIWVLPHEKHEPNVRVGEKMPDSTIRVYEYYRVNPYRLSVTSIKY